MYKDKQKTYTISSFKYKNLKLKKKEEKNSLKSCF
jgi:hypothetical protein